MKQEARKGQSEIKNLFLEMRARICFRDIFNFELDEQLFSFVFSSSPAVADFGFVTTMSCPSEC